MVSLIAVTLASPPPPGAFTAEATSVYRAALRAGDALDVRVSVELAPAQHPSRMVPRPNGHYAESELPLTWQAELIRPALEVFTSLVDTANAVDSCDRYELEVRAPAAFVVRQIRHLNAHGVCVDSPRPLDVPVPGFPRPPLSSFARPWLADWDWTRALTAACMPCEVHVAGPVHHEGTATTLRGLLAELERSQTDGPGLWWTLTWTVGEERPDLEVWSGTTVDPYRPRQPTIDPLSLRHSAARAARSSGQLDPIAYEEEVGAIAIARIEEELARGEINAWQAAARKENARADMLQALRDQAHLTEQQYRERREESLEMERVERRALGEMPRIPAPAPDTMEP
jgi:hypothetical protein